MNFTCNYCLRNYNQDYLASINEYESESLFKKKDILEKELTGLETEQILAINSKTSQDFEVKIKQLTQKLDQLYLQEKVKKEYVCKFCFNKFIIKETKSFVCDICGLEIKGRKFEGHIENYQLQGISPLS
mgnify:CR=1 FL=1